MSLSLLPLTMEKGLLPWQDKEIIAAKAHVKDLSALFRGRCDGHRFSMDFSMSPSVISEFKLISSMRFLAGKKDPENRNIPLKNPLLHINFL